MNRITSLFTMAGISSLLSLSIATAAPMPSSAGLGKQVVTVTQNVGDNNMSAVRASVAPLVNSTKGYGNTVSTIPVALPATLATIAPVPVSPGMKESAILAMATAHFKANGPGLAVRMGDWMKTKGLAFGWFTYTQKIMLSIPQASGTVGGSVGGGSGGGGGVIQYQQMLAAVTDPTDGGGSGGASPVPSALAPATEERLLVWTMNTDQNGRLLFGNPVIIPPRPKTLYIVYTPLKLEQGLPDGWKYPNAGTLFVQTRDENHVPIPGTDERIDVAGAFDEPTDTTGTSVDDAPAVNADGAIECMMDNSKLGCTNSVSVRSLMDSRGANMAVVDYLRKVQPVYDEPTPGNLVPRSQLVITKREVQYNGCSDALYSNEGNYQFLLKSTATRFLVTADGNYGAVAESSTTETSPGVSYSGQLSVQGADVSKLDGYVINPTDPSNPQLVAIADVAPQSVAPLTTSGSSSGVMVYRESAYIHTGGNTLNTHVYVGCNALTGTVDFSAGWKDVGSNAAVGWTPNLNRYTIGTQFTKGRPEVKTIFSREDPQHEYCSGSASYDGNNSISLNMSATCAYGDVLTKGNITFVNGYQPVYSYDGLGSLFPQYCAAGSYGTASGQTPVNVITSGEGGYSTYMNGASRTGCVYNYNDNMLMSQEDVQNGLYSPCNSVEDTAIYFPRFDTVTTGDGSATIVTYTGRACVAPTNSSWSLSW